VVFITPSSLQRSRIRKRTVLDYHRKRRSNKIYCYLAQVWQCVTPSSYAANVIISIDYRGNVLCDLVAERLVDYRSQTISPTFVNLNNSFNDL